MLAIILLSVLLPISVGMAYLVLRNTQPEVLSDIRGIALQTVVIIVVLLAIAGAVAGVLVSRGNDAVSQLEDQNDFDPASEYTDQARCEDAGFTWGGTPAACTS